MNNAKFNDTAAEHTTIYPILSVVYGGAWRVCVVGTGLHRCHGAALLVHVFSLFVKDWIEIQMILSSAKSGPGTASITFTRMFEPRHDILSNVRADIRK